MRLLLMFSYNIECYNSSRNNIFTGYYVSNRKKLRTIVTDRLIIELVYSFFQLDYFSTRFEKRKRDLSKFLFVRISSKNFTSNFLNFVVQASFSFISYSCGNSYFFDQYIDQRMYIQCNIEVVLHK